MLNEVYLHITFSTEQRISYLADSEIKSDLIAFMTQILEEIGSPALKIGGGTEHIHILCKMSPNISQDGLVQTIKMRSEQWMIDQGGTYELFKWQHGYGVFSINPNQLNIVKRYIAQQKTHHSTTSYETEYMSLLNNMHVPHDADDLWH